MSEWRWYLNIAPAHHTPMDKQSGRAIKRSISSMHRALDRMVPWKTKEKVERLKKKTKKNTAKEALRQSEALAQRLGM